MAEGDLWEDLFGGDEPQAAPAPAQAEAAPARAAEGKEKKEKKDKKDKSDKKEKKEKKDKGEKEKEVAVPEKVDLGGKKEKKDKKEKKEKSKNKGSAGFEAAPEPASQEPVAVLPLIEASQPLPAETTAASSSGKPAKEKKDKKDKKDKEKDKEKKDKKDKKEKKDKAEGFESAPEKPAKDKKEKKDKKDKKEKKEKKRKAESEPTDGAPDTPGAEAAATPAGDSQAAAAADPFFADFGEVQEEEELFGTDIFNDVFTKAFAEDEQPGSAPRDAVGTPRDFQTPAAELPVVQALPPRKKLKETKSKVEETSKTDQRSLCDKWTEVMDAIKRAPQLSIHEKDSIPYVQGFVQEMIAAAQQDEEDFQEGKPMLHKLRMLPKAVEVMKKYAFMEIFVTFQGCRALALWLKTLPSGELPSVHIRTALLECMMRLPITKEALQQSKDAPLGQVLAKLSQNPRETVGNRKAAAELVQKWLKQVLAKKPTASFDLDTFGEDEQPQGTLIRPPPETAETLRALEEESLTRNHPKVPIIAGKEYAVMPLPKHQPVRREKKDGESNRTKLAGVLQIMARPNKKSWKPYAPEVAGGKLNMM